METPQPSLGRFIALIMIGAGLISIGVTLFMLMSRYFDSTAPDEFSAIPVEVNYTAPDLDLKDLDGNKVSLNDYRGKVVMVNLWATWCPPCKKEMPTLEAFYQKYKNDDFVLVAIDQEETRDVVVPFVVNNGLTFPIWLDPGYEAQTKFNTMGLPSSYVLDRDGKVRLMWIGSISGTNLEKYVPNVIFGN